MHIETSQLSSKHLAKIARLREYFQTDNPKMYEWSDSDEEIDFEVLSDSQIELYLERGH